MKISEGHFAITKTFRSVYCDHGPCTGFYIAELNLTVWAYDEDPTRISFHEGDESAEVHGVPV